MKTAYLLLTMMLLLVATASATPLSIIESDYITFDSDIAGPVWAVTVRGDNDASYVVFGDAEDLTTTVEGETATPQNDFTLLQSIESESCEYNLVNTARNDLYQYNIDLTADNAWAWQVSDLIEDCYNIPGGVLAWGKNEFVGTGLTQDVYCLRETQLANAGSVQEGRINFNSKFSLAKNDETPIIKQISTLATDGSDIPSSVAFTDGKRTVAVARWIGGTTFGEFCPGQDEFVAIETSNRWYTASRDSFLLYNEQYIELQELINKVKGTETITSDERRDVERLVTAVNERGSAALTEKKIATDARISGSKATITLSRDHLIYAPDFQILLSADWLGIVYQTSKPKIIDAKFNTCSEAGENSFYVTVENVGNQESTFDIGATCETGISLSATKRSITLDPGKSGTVTVPFTLSLGQDQSRSCTIIVSDRLNPDQEDRESISTNCQASDFCTPNGRKDCFGEVEKICQDGLWVDTESEACVVSLCNRDGVCDIKDGESFEACGGKTVSNNDCATCNLDGSCDATETEYSCAADCGPPKPATNPIWLVLGGVVAAVGLFFGMQAIKPAKSKKKRGRKK